jgi:hypothetical protein
LADFAGTLGVHRASDPVSDIPKALTSRQRRPRKSVSDIRRSRHCGHQRENRILPIPEGESTGNEFGCASAIYRWTWMVL